MTDHCEAKAVWQRANGGEKFPSVHAYDHSAKPRGDYCFWCGQHRSGDGTTMRPEAAGYSFEHWMEDALEFGFKVDDE